METVSNEQARFFLPDVGSRITARVAHRGLYQLTLTQELPFLRLDSGVTDANGRNARIRNVTLEVHGSVPQLMLDVEYPEPVEVEAPVGREAAGEARPQESGDCIDLDANPGDDLVFEASRREPTQPYAIEVPEAQTLAVSDAAPVVSEEPIAESFDECAEGDTREAVALATPPPLPAPRPVPELPWYRRFLLWVVTLLLQ
ncbi:MAG: hypothetical protein AAGF12_37115 [Myxococcota bacterium]